MSYFFNIIPRDEALEDLSNAIPLRVVLGDGVEVSPDLRINVNQLSKGYDSFYNTSGKGDTFKISILIKRNDKVGDIPLTEYLDSLMRTMTPLLINTDAIDIKDGKDNQYIIIKNDSRKQTNTNHTVWDLEFKTYNPVNVFKYENNNAGVQSALAKAKQNKNKKKTTKSVKNAKLRKCNYKTLVYSKKKKVVNCVKYMQQVLKNNKCYSGKIDGWFGLDTKKAVQKFQKQYNKKNVLKFKTTQKGYAGIKVTAGTLVTNTNNNPNIKLPSLSNPNITTKQTTGNKSTKVTVKSVVLPTNGKVDKNTWKALCNS